MGAGEGGISLTGLDAYNHKPSWLLADEKESVEWEGDFMKVITSVCFKSGFSWRIIHFQRYYWTSILSLVWSLTFHSFWFNVNIYFKLYVFLNKLCSCSLNFIIVHFFKKKQTILCLMVLLLFQSSLGWVILKTKPCLVKPVTFHGE